MIESTIGQGKGSDLISRQAAIEAIGRDPMGGLNYERILRDMPVESRWIPCSERLPEVDMYRTLTTIRTPHRGANVRSGCFYRGCFMNDNGDVWNATDEEVIAWMPLPEPYQEGGQ